MRVTCHEACSSSGRSSHAGLLGSRSNCGLTRASPRGMQRRRPRGGDGRAMQPGGSPTEDFRMHALAQRLVLEDRKGVLTLRNIYQRSSMRGPRGVGGKHSVAAFATNPRAGFRLRRHAHQLCKSRCANRTARRDLSSGVHGPPASARNCRQAGTACPRPCPLPTCLCSKAGLGEFRMTR